MLYRTYGGDWKAGLQFQLPGDKIFLMTLCMIEETHAKWRTLLSVETL